MTDTPQFPPQCLTGKAIAKHLGHCLRAAGWEHRLGDYLSHVQQVSLAPQQPSPALSVVILTWKPTPDAGQTLAALRQQKKALQKQGERFEIILVDNGSEANAAAPLAALADVFLRLRTNTGAYLARNLGSAFAGAPLLLFLEDDGQPEAGLVAAHLKDHQRFDILMARGVYRPRSDSPLNRYAGHYYLGDKPFPRFCDLEGNASIRASAFREVGGWDDAIFFGHGGVDLSYRLVQRFGRPEQLIYTPDPVLHHDYAKSEEHLVRKRQRQAKSRAYLNKKIPELDAFLESYQQRYKRLEIPVRPSGKA